MAQNENLLLRPDKFGGPTRAQRSESHGSQNAPGNIFSGMMTLAITGDKALSGKYSKATAESAKSQLTSLKAEVAAHQGDMQWMMSPAGQAVIQKMESIAANATGVAAGSSGGNGGPPTSPASMAYDLGVNWSNGSSNPVDFTVGFDHTNGGSLKDQIHVTVEQQQ